jgi:NADPH-dependent 2,4-dienoyl-CoA reductase/sulfur reductase-like enzyme/rhodanese-related sulfurtransferase
MGRRTIVVIGGALSGPTAAARARETDEAARIVLLERSRDVSYAACGLAYHLSGEVRSLAALNRERAEFFRDVYGIEVHTGTRVLDIDARRHAVHLDGGALAYDALIYAAGAESVVPDVLGLAGARNVHTFRTLPDLAAILRCLRRGARRVAILGAGFIGIEAADGFLRRGRRVTVVEQGPRILPRFTPEMSGVAAAALRRAGAAIVTGAEVVGALRSGLEVRALRFADGGTLKTDLVIAAAGLRPRTTLLREAGARLLADGSVPVDERCATSLPGVFACGVCVSLPHAVSGRRTWFAQAAQADKTAQVAGTCAAGGRAAMPPVLGTAVLRAGDLTLARTGLTEAEAARCVGPRLRGARIHAPSCDTFLPTSRPLAITLLYDQRSGRLLGAEVASRAGADKRVDVLAAAIAGGLTVEKLAALDLAYAPPYASARDPVNVVGTVAAAARGGMADAWTPSQVHARRDRLTLVDVRPAAERRSGRISGSLRLPLEVLRERVRGLRGGGPVVFVCETGRHGYLAARVARRRGLRGAGYLMGGLRSWRAEGLPVAGQREGR